VARAHGHAENHARHAASSARRAKDLATRHGSPLTELVAFWILHDAPVLPRIHAHEVVHVDLLPDALFRRPKSENPLDLGVDAFHPLLKRDLPTTGNVEIKVKAVLVRLRRVHLLEINPRSDRLRIDDCAGGIPFRFRYATRPEELGPGRVADGRVRL